MKLLSSPAIQFKGSGFYITDYARKDSGSKDAGKEAGKDSSKDKDTGKSADKDAGTSPAASTSSSDSSSTDAGAKGGSEKQFVAPNYFARTGPELELGP